MTYWQTLSRREKILMMVAVTLFLTVIFSFVIIRPLLSYHARGMASYAQARETFDATMRVVEMDAYHKATRGATDGSLQDVINAQALRDDIAYSALRMEQDGHVRITLDANRAMTIFLWLKNLEEHHGIVVRQAQIHHRGHGDRVSASLLLGSQR